MADTPVTSSSSYGEVFCAELPSQCNLYLSGKRTTRHRAHHDGKKAAPIMRFATEQHSLTLSQKKRGGRDEYSLSAAHLPPSSSAGRGGGEPKKVPAAIDKSEEPCDVCLAHSSVFWGDIPGACQESSLEVFAMARTSISEGETKEQKTSSDNASLTTHESHSVSEGGKSGGDGSDQKPTDVATSSAKKGDGGHDDKHIALPKHYLRVRSKVLLEQASKMKTEERHIQDKQKKATHNTSTTIPLDFRPLAVHATELHISTDEKEIDCSRRGCSAIGIFVTSVDDNKLRLYITSKGQLQRRKAKQDDDMPCFVPMLLHDASTVIEVQGLEDAPDDNPLVFSTPIMAIDTLMTSGCSLTPDEGVGDTQLNRLAIACYDGTVRVMTYRLKQQNPNDCDDGSGFRCSHLRCSAFVVDGPVVSLCFGKVHESKVQLPQNASTLFLVAGSLCGFACLFYECALPPFNDSPSGRQRYWGGPLPIVDWLYDVRQEGYEDCVTTVRVCCRGAENSPLIAVGTQGGRLLIFQQCPKESNTPSDSNAIADHAALDELVLQIEQKREEMTRLQSEKEEVDAKAADLNRVISDINSKIDEVTTTAPSQGITEASCELGIGAIGEEKSEPIENDATVLDATLNESIEEKVDPLGNNELPLSKRDDAEPAQGDTTNPDATPLSNEMEEKEESDPSHIDDETPQVANELFDLGTELEAAQAELIALEQKIADHAAKIATLQSDVDELMEKKSSQERLIRDRHPTPSETLRKMHRYEFQCEHHLPYPIHGIAYRDGGTGLEIFVSTRRSFHVFQETSPMVIEEKVSLLEQNITKLLAT